MKKIVGIIAALALASAVFADPDVTPTVATFSGDASIEYDINLDETSFGIVNGENADFEIQFVAAGDKATTGDGLWGELKIKVGDAVKVKGSKGAEADAFKFKGAVVDTAKIHFTDDDFYAVMNIKAPGLSLGGGKLVTATWSDNDNKVFPSAKVTLTDAAGFTLNFGLKDIVDFNLQYADNGVKKADAKKFAFVFDASLKAVENLGLYVGAGYGTEAKAFVAAAKVDYKLGLTDTLYLKPAVGFSFDEAKAKTLSAALLLGWGKENQEAKFAKFKGDTGDWDNVCDKVSDGFSVYAGVPLAKDAAIPFLVSVYDSTLVENLKMGAQFYAPNITKMDGAAAWAADAAVAWGSGDLLGDWKVSANFGVEIEKLAEVKAGFLWGCGVENGAIIDNTTLYLNYAGQAAKDIQNLGGTIKGIDQKGTIKLGAKIHF